MKTNNLPLARCIDHTCLKPEATGRDIHRLVAEATEYGFAAVCVNGRFIADVSKALQGTGIKTCGVVGFPLGASRVNVKTTEATLAVQDGADEIDFVAHLPHLLRCALAQAKTEFQQVVKAARAADPRVVIKVIIESALLLSDVAPDIGRTRIKAACQAARESGCDFVKTSSGFHPAGGASVEAVRVIKENTEGIGVKAAGGIACYQDAMNMIEAGADRLGCTASVKVVTKV